MVYFKSLITDSGITCNFHALYEIATHISTKKCHIVFGHYFTEEQAWAKGIPTGTSIYDINISNCSQSLPEAIEYLKTVESWDYILEAPPEPSNIKSTANPTPSGNIAIEDPRAILRNKRNLLLQQSDWTQLPDAPVDHQAWATYRQELRDLPSVFTSLDIDWPKPPA